MTMDTFMTEIRRRVDKKDPAIKNEWNRLAEKHGVPDMVGNMPVDEPGAAPGSALAAFAEDPADLAAFKTEIGRRLEAKDPTIAASWDQLAVRYKVGRLVGHAPADLAAFVAEGPLELKHHAVKAMAGRKPLPSEPATALGGPGFVGEPPAGPPSPRPV